MSVKGDGQNVSFRDQQRFSNPADDIDADEVVVFVTGQNPEAIKTYYKELAANPRVDETTRKLATEIAKHGHAAVASSLAAQTT